MQKKREYLKVPMRQYHYISKKDMNGVTGFVTENVCECVAGVIIGRDGYAMYHFSVNDDPGSLADNIWLDFHHTDNIKHIIFGGNVVDSFFPWKSKNRHVLFTSTPKKDCNQKIEQTATDFKKDEDAMNAIKEESDRAVKMSRSFPGLFPDIGWHYGFTRLTTAAEEKYKIEVAVDDVSYSAETFYTRCAVFEKKLGSGLFTYDVNQLNNHIRLFSSEMAANKVLFAAISKQIEFIPYGLKDCVGYQNLARLIEELRLLHLFNRDNTIHFNTLNDATIFFNFREEEYSVYSEANVPDYYEAEAKLNGKHKKLDFVNCFKRPPSLNKNKGVVNTTYSYDHQTVTGLSEALSHLTKDQCRSILEYKKDKLPKMFKNFDDLITAFKNLKNEEQRQVLFDFCKKISPPLVTNSNERDLVLDYLESQKELKQESEMSGPRV